MRLWTLHPRYLDTRGLVALWREALLAQKVLAGHTRGYQHHPQLFRFRASPDPQATIATYLADIFEEASRRGYAFDADKIGRDRYTSQLDETDGQLQYEWDHLTEKLMKRAPEWLSRLRVEKILEPHPLFRVVPGDVQVWERRGPEPPLRT